MFVRWQNRSRAVRQGREPDPLLSAALVETVRIQGKPRHRHLGYLGSIRSRGLGPTFIHLRMQFWNAVSARLDRLDLPASERAGVEAALAERVPRPSAQERESAEAEFERWKAVASAVVAD